MNKKLAAVLIGVGISVGLMGGAASAGPPFDTQCVANSTKVAAYANAGTGFDLAGFIKYIKENDCAIP